MSQSCKGTTTVGLSVQDTFGSLGPSLRGTNLDTKVSKDSSFGGTNLATGDRLVSKGQRIGGGAKLVTTGEIRANPLDTIDRVKKERCFNALKSYVRIGDKHPNGRTRIGYCSFCGTMYSDVSTTIYHLRMKHFKPDIMEFVCPQVDCDHIAPSSALMLDHLKTSPDHQVTAQSLGKKTLTELVKFIRPKEASQPPSDLTT